MKSIYLIILAVICMSFSSCLKKKASDAEKDYLSTLLKEYSLPRTTEWVVVLPGLGCHGCIQEGEAFMKDYVHAKNTSFILTRIESLKILSQKTNINIDEQKNIIVDTAGTINILSENAVYPCIIKVKDGEYLEHAFQSPQNTNAFNKLRMMLK